MLIKIWLKSLSQRPSRYSLKIFSNHRHAAMYSLVNFSLYVFLLASNGAAAAEGDATTQPPELLLANVYEAQVDLDDYWVSEKLDGVRAYWDGNRFLSRQGNIYSAPSWFTEGLPAIPLDGELWMGRGTFDELSGAVRRQIPDDNQWRKIRFMVFDLPASPELFDQRLILLEDILAVHPSDYLVMVEQFRLPSHDALQASLEDIVAAGGEGLMLHRADSYYEATRSDDLLKVKTYDDAEAIVLAHYPGSGKYSAVLGSMLVETPEKLRFKLGSGFSDAERAEPPPIGSTVTYKFFGKTKNGTPRFASFLRVRRSE